MAYGRYSKQKTHIETNKNDVQKKKKKLDDSRLKERPPCPETQEAFYFGKNVQRLIASKYVYVTDRLVLGVTAHEPSHGRGAAADSKKFLSS